jgi:hypothetical protein
VTKRKTSKFKFENLNLRTSIGDFFICTSQYNEAEVHKVLQPDPVDEQDPDHPRLSNFILTQCRSINRIEILIFDVASADKKRSWLQEQTQSEQNYSDLQEFDLWFEEELENLLEQEELFPSD